MTETKVYVIHESCRYEHESYIHKIFSTRGKALKYLEGFKVCGTNSLTGGPAYWDLDDYYILSLEEETCY